MHFAIISALFAAGFVVAHLWAVHAYASIVGISERFIIVAAIEVLVGVTAFSLVRGKRRGSALLASGAAALLCGFIANTVTVGPMAIIPPFQPAPLVVYILAIAVAAALLGYLHRRLWSQSK